MTYDDYMGIVYQYDQSKCSLEITNSIIDSSFWARLNPHTGGGLSSVLSIRNNLLSGQFDASIGSVYWNSASINSLPGSGNNFQADPGFIDQVEGDWTGFPILDPEVITTTFVDDTATFITDEYVGNILIMEIDEEQLLQGLIVGNTATNITVSGLYTDAITTGTEKYFIVDLHLKSDSPAVDRGASNDVPDHDLDGVPRPQGEEVDIGAYEFSGGDEDEDGVGTYYEINWFGTDPNNGDTDGDGLSDWEELFLFATNALVVDSDGDGLNDRAEVMSYGTNPLSDDSDDDGFNDFAEVNGFNTDPNDAADYPKAVYVKPTGNGSGNGSSWSNAMGSIQAAIDSVGSGVEIWVAGGVYHESVSLKSGITIYGGFRGDELFAEHRRVFEYETIIDGSGSSDYPLTISGVTDTVVDGFTVTGGNTLVGGGVYVSRADASNRLMNCRVVGNQATYHGGGMAVVESSLYIINCVIGNNTAGQLGGGIYLNESSPVIANGTFSGNRAGGNGGAIAAYASHPSA